MDYRVINADVLDGLRQLPDASVNCCVTSPPYWGLRNYGHAGQIGLERTPEEYVSRLVAERYYYDADAIREPAVAGWNGSSFTSDSDKATRDGLGIVPRIEKEGRNKRSVWTVPTQAFPGAHFATFPEDLVQPCILAGCPEGGTVIDPFAGSGTVGAVAVRLNRNFIGVELNPTYSAMARERIWQEAPLLNQEVVA